MKIINSTDKEERGAIQLIEVEVKEEKVITQKETVKRISFDRLLAVEFIRDWKNAKSRRLNKTKNKSIESHSGTSPIPNRYRGRNL